MVVLPYATRLIWRVPLGEGVGEGVRVASVIGY